jgi:Zn-dependent peptidase ImmA (M78 family)
MTPERELQLEEAADRARARLYVYDALPLDLMVALSRIGDLAYSPRASYKVLPIGLMKYDEAYTDGLTKTIFLSDITFEELRNGSPHKRFTVAHELAHLDLGHSGVRSRALHGRDFRKQANISGVWQEESDANFWAGAFLMPTRTVMESKTSEELAVRCAVSLSAARIRQEGFERRLRRTRGELRPIPDRARRLLADLFRSVGVTPKSFKIDPPQQVLQTVAAESAEIQGYLPVPCLACGSFRLVPEGGCVTCTNCGDSNCS